jgi:hypothetical protein
MKNGERIIVSSILVLLLFTWLGFLLHSAPRFAGSGIGAVFGVSGAALMLLPLAYVFVKRIPSLKEHTAKYVNLQTILSLHVYAGIVGAFLAVIHTGHKYDSVLGISLTATMLLMIVSGFVVRYLLAFVSLDMKDKLLLLETARGDLDNAWGISEMSRAGLRGMPRAPLVTAGLASVGVMSDVDGPASHLTAVAEGVADLEYSIRTHEVMKRWFASALTTHIILSIAFYVLLCVHIGAGIYFGLRWIQ